MCTVLSGCALPDSSSPDGHISSTPPRPDKPRTQDRIANPGPSFASPSSRGSSPSSDTSRVMKIQPIRPASKTVGPLIMKRTPASIRVNSEPFGSRLGLEALLGFVLAVIAFLGAKRLRKIFRRNPQFPRAPKRKLSLVSRQTRITTPCLISDYNRDWIDRSLTPAVAPQSSP